MLLDEPHELVEGVDQVGADDEPVVVTLRVLAPQKRIELVTRHKFLNRRVEPEHQTCSEVVGGLAGVGVCADESRDSQQILRRQTGPRVLGLPSEHQPPGPLEECGVEVRHAQVRKHPLLSKDAEFAVQ